MTAGKTVFVLGAGASAQGGAPLMRDFLDVAEALSSQQGVGDTEAFQLVFRGIAALQRVYAKAALDTLNLESVFSAFEMADLVGRLPGIEDEEIPRLAPALRRVIARTLEHSLLFRVDSRGTRQAPVPYQRFVDHLFRPLGPEKASVITFNYDLGLDYGFIAHGHTINYALSPDPNSGFQILKLHGSLNWLLCERCHCVRACDSNQVANAFTPVEENVMRMNSLDQVIRCPNCRIPAQDRFLVPPTLTKGEGHRAIKNVWRRAAEAFSSAENIFVIGYSLPPTDEFFRYLFALGTISDVRPKRFWVFDPEPTVAPRFEQFLGPTMKDRFRHFLGDFGSALETLRYDRGRQWPATR